MADTKEFPKAASNAPLEKPKPANALKSKKAQLASLLKRKSGVSAPALCKTLGWQPHTLRAAISGLRKSGHQIETRRTATGDATLYRMMGDAPRDTSRAKKVACAETRA
jgi:biotin operon repressor